MIDAKLVDKDTFGQLIESIRRGEDIPSKIDTINAHNYCPECNIPMKKAGYDYKCTECGRTQSCDSFEITPKENLTGGCIRVTTGANKGRYYNTGESNKSRQKLADALIHAQEQYKHDRFGNDVLTAAATQLNHLKKIIIDDKKNIFRSSMRGEILGALIYFEGIRVGNVRFRSSICKFINFIGYKISGFSRGEDKLRELNALGLIDIPRCDEPISSFIERYLENLHIVSDAGIDYAQFILDIVQLSESKKISMSRKIPSKVVGVIYLIIICYDLPIKVDDLEKGTDNTKKSTFIKFYNDIYANIHIFKEVFERHNIKYIK